VNAQPFVEDVTRVVECLGAMHQRLEADMRSLLVYFGEDVSTTKAEELFGLVASFASWLEVSGPCEMD
jgi:hypothetical protein